jgi:prepilin-type N-terminal cleavage/methylation domain-containing protein
VPGPSATRRRGGFTLIELLVVILIILLVSAIALPVVIPAMAHRQVSEAARILQAALAGARDAALRTGSPSGIRLLPDPAFALKYIDVPNSQYFGQIDYLQPLAANRIIPIEAPPEYSEGALNVSVVNPPPPLNTDYPKINGGGFYPVLNNAFPVIGGVQRPANVLMVVESMLYLNGNNTNMNEPTAWFWNIRVGDKLQINGSGLWYTVVGPMEVTPQQGNTEMFVNVGLPGTALTWQQAQPPLAQPPLQTQIPVFPEFLFLVNGIDDDGNGWIDEGFDGIDNNSNGVIDDLLEWETESWHSTILSGTTAFNLPYTIQRRPAPASNSRETALPTGVVIDLTTWNFPVVYPNSVARAERSQFPRGVLNPSTGYVDILVNPNGTVVPTTVYSTPTSFGMDGAYYHFWLAERSDVVPPISPGPNPPQVTFFPPYLPIGTVPQVLLPGTIPSTQARLQGEYRVVTLFTRTGQVSTIDNAQFDNPRHPANAAEGLFSTTGVYNPYYPFLAAQNGAGGGQ